jgi:hypothetical protein
MIQGCQTAPGSRLSAGFSVERDRRSTVLIESAGESLGNPSLTSSWTAGFTRLGIGAVGGLDGAMVGASAIGPGCDGAIVSCAWRSSCSRLPIPDRTALDRNSPRIRTVGFGPPCRGHQKSAQPPGTSNGEAAGARVGAGPRGGWGPSRLEVPEERESSRSSLSLGRWP